VVRQTKDGVSRHVFVSLRHMTNSRGGAIVCCQRTDLGCEVCRGFRGFMRRSAFAVTIGAIAHKDGRSSHPRSHDEMAFAAFRTDPLSAHSSDPKR
jgi:hypothetical protein